MSNTDDRLDKIREEAAVADMYINMAAEAKAEAEAMAAEDKEEDKEKDEEDTKIKKEKM